jgi:polygalacturonase
MFFEISKAAVFCLDSAAMKCFWLLMVACLPLAPLLLVNAATAASGPAGVFNVLDHGAQGDGVSPDTSAIQQTVDACAAAGGGQVLLPAGRTYLAGAITLRSGVDFHVPRGAVLKMSPNWRDYGHEGALLFAKDGLGISITGDGVLDGQDRAVWQRLADEEAEIGRAHV